MNFAAGGFWDVVGGAAEKRLYSVTTARTYSSSLKLPEHVKHLSIPACVPLRFCLFYFIDLLYY